MNKVNCSLREYTYVSVCIRMHMGRHLCTVFCWTCCSFLLHKQSEDHLGFPAVPTRICSKWSRFSLLGFLALTVNKKGAVRVGNTLITATESQKAFPFGANIQHNFRPCIQQCREDETVFSVQGVCLSCISLPPSLMHCVFVAVIFYKMLYEKFICPKASWSCELTLSWLVKVKRYTVGEILPPPEDNGCFVIDIERQHFPPPNFPKGRTICVRDRVQMSVLMYYLLVISNIISPTVYTDNWDTELAQIIAREKGGQEGLGFLF